MFLVNNFRCGMSVNVYWAITSYCLGTNYHVHPVFNLDLPTHWGGSHWGEPHTGQNFMLSTIHKKIQIKIGELTTASIFARVMVHDTVKVTARLQYFHICSCNGS